MDAWELAAEISKIKWDTNMLISQDLMYRLAKFVEAPAQLCLIRVLGSDHEYVFRVRYQDVHLDYPLTVPLLDDANQVTKVCNWDLVAGALAAMSAMVVPPAARAEWQLNHYAHYSPAVLAPMSSNQFHLWDEIEYA